LREAGGPAVVDIPRRRMGRGDHRGSNIFSSKQT
jgi:hypothetical protein